MLGYAIRPLTQPTRAKHKEEAEMGRRRINPDSELNIKRIDSKKKKTGGGTHGFQVYFGRSDVEYTRLFSDGVYGGKEAARLEARNFRPILEQAIPPSRAAAAARTGPARSNTGHMGISITSDPLKSGEKTLYVEASVRIEKGTSKNRQFRVGERPLAEVIQEALAWRNQLLEDRKRREDEESANLPA